MSAKCLSAHRPPSFSVENWEVQVGSKSNWRVWSVPVFEVLRLTLGEKSLSGLERLEVRQLLRKSDRDRFVAGRILLRHVLARIVDPRISPYEWLYHRDKFGKLALADACPQFDFSLSHADEVVTVALSSTGAIGVDIESMMPGDNSKIVYDALTERERKLIYRHPEDQRWNVFVRLWTL